MEHQQSHMVGGDGNAAYGYYNPPETEAASYPMPYAPYQVPAQGQTRPLSVDMHQPQGMQYSMNLYAAQSPYSTPSPHGNMPIAATPPPPSPEMYEHPLSPPLSGSDTSGDGLYHHSNSSHSGTESPASSRGNSLVHRHHSRYNPTAASSSKHRRSHSNDSDDDDMTNAFPENIAHSRKEATRKQRIEAEQRRRDDLRDGYAKLKDVLPISNQKSSKVSLLDRAVQYIIKMEKEAAEMKALIASHEHENNMLRAIHDRLALSSNGETPSPGHFDARPLSPPPDPQHPIGAMHRIQETTVSTSSSPAASTDDGY